jgi:hypothetical protein
MKKIIAPIAIAGVFFAGMSVATAGVIADGMTDDFNDGTTMGWTNGARVKTPHPPHVENGVLVVESFGERLDDDGKVINDNKRMAFFNESYSYDRGKNTYDSPWEGDYTDINSITANYMATSSTEDNLYMRLSFTDGDNFYSSKTAFVLPTDGKLHSYTFCLDYKNFAVSDQYNDGSSFKAAEAAAFDESLKHIFGLKFLSNKDNPIYGGSDVVAAKLSIDNIMASSAVPLPGAVWLMISGLLGLNGLSSYKRSKA